MLKVSELIQGAMYPTSLAQFCIREKWQIKFICSSQQLLNVKWV